MIRPRNGTTAETTNQTTNELPLIRPTMPPAMPKNRQITRYAPPAIWDPRYRIVVAAQITAAITAATRTTMNTVTIRPITRWITSAAAATRIKPAAAFFAIGG